MSYRPTTLLLALLILVITGPACRLTSDLTARLDQTKITASPTRRLMVFPAASSHSSPADLAPNQLPVAGQPLAPTPHPANPVRRPTATARPATFLDRVNNLFTAPTPTATRAWRLAVLPTVPPSPTSTATPLPTLAPTATPSPTDTPLPTATPLPTNTPLPTETPTFTPILPPPATATPAPPSPTPLPQYDFLLAEFYNSPTSNSFLVIYVAVVDVNEIPIGDMKIVGTRKDHNLSYESPLSTWFYEGYSAPGSVVKSGNLKFEPPAGLETTSWVLYLADAQGKRLSADIPFDTDENNKQWYFIKLKRKY